MNVIQAGDRPKKRVFPYAAIIISLAVAFVDSVSVAQSTTGNTSEKSSLPQEYLDAIEDAKKAEPSEIYRNLTPIVWYNPDLKWDKSRVLVVAWTTFNGYRDNVGKLMLLDRDLWVTAVPDLQKFCKTYSPTTETSLEYRLNQVLGLPPDLNPDKKRYIVELWVEPRSLFRPAKDPSITDREAELEFPLANSFESVSTTYQDWFNQQFKSRYASENRYPWTQLGYTYDWGNQNDWKKLDPKRSPHVGLSEFVIREWSQVSVYSAKSVQEYCRD
ncbi:MAG: hypothetical protein RMX96_09415 [Nostoc sp. ChiSLP02]|nr:hypothetical protein [Nostoc sp. DedSLP05]MDZ8101959.1 hypothetical protein [Nostoc sp. DedSLP01]MDZ8185058.1 hypothetical protein [Nostoc sp. ChiSLP02]